MTTNVPGPVFSPTGFIIPSDSAILDGVVQDINQAFGGNLNPALTTPQGQLATSMAAIVANSDATFLEYTQLVDPAYSFGRMQDAIARIYFLSRNPALPTAVSAYCTGLQGTVIPAGAFATTTDGTTRYVCVDGGTIGPSGNITLTFNCIITGPIACPANTLTVIYQAIPGWDSINNPSDGVLGNDVESRAAFEARRAASVAANSRGALPSVVGAVLSVSGVLDAYVTENSTGSPVTVGGVTLAAHSIYVAAVGGADLDVATAIWSKKAPGCAYNGNTTVTVQDTNSGYNPPYPSYSVTFERPSSQAIKFAVSIVNSTSVPSDATAQIQAAIIAAFAGEDGGTRARIGDTIYASRYYAPVAALGSWALISELLIGTSSATLLSVTLNINQAPTVAGTDISVTLV